MLYLANPTGRAVEYMKSGVLGFIDTPAQGNKRPKGVTWCADNGCFGRGYPGDDAWLSWLERNADDADTCLFATAPDVPEDAAATMERSVPFLPEIRRMGYPAALVGQDGLEEIEPPWAEFDALFIGGSTEWKLSRAARDLVGEANARGKHTHLGRVNSKKRLRYADAIGCDSCDGTYLTFGPDVNLPKLLSWIESLEREPGLFSLTQKPHSGKLT